MIHYFFYSFWWLHNGLAIWVAIRSQASFLRRSGRLKKEYDGLSPTVPKRRLGVSRKSQARHSKSKMGQMDFFFRDLCARIQKPDSNWTDDKAFQSRFPSPLSIPHSSSSSVAELTGIVQVPFLIGADCPFGPLCSHSLPTGVLSLDVANRDKDAIKASYLNN